MHRILDYKPEAESVVVSRVHSVVMEALERQFPHLRQPTSHFDMDEATVVTHSPYGLDESSSNKMQSGSLATPGKSAATTSEGRVRRDGGGKSEKATAHPKRQEPPRKSSVPALPPEIPQGEKTYLVAIVSICAFAALLVLWFASSFVSK